MSNNTYLLRRFIQQSLHENKDHEEEIMDDFLNSDMYKKVAHLIENFQFKLFESEQNKPIIQNARQVSKVHLSLQKHFNRKDLASPQEIDRRLKLLYELERVKNNKDFHERKANIHKFLDRLGIALEATPFLFILIYLFNTNNPALIEWCDSVNSVTLAEGFVAFMSMFLFGEKLRAGQKKNISTHQGAVDLYADKQKSLEDELSPHLNDRGITLKK